MKFNRLGAFTLGVVITAVSVGAVSFVNAAGDKQLRACANKKTGVMRYIAKGSCNKKTETTLFWNQMGSQGLPGAAGTNGTNGIAGTNGTNGAAGAKGDTGATGAKGDTGATGTSGALTNSQIKNICGVNGTTACAVGQQGPGGGVVFMTPSTLGNTTGLFYEAAPSTWSSPSGDPLSAWCDNTNTELGVPSILSGTGAMDGANKTTVMLGVCTSGAANLADAYSATVNGVVYGDWFLPSKGELNQMYANRTVIGGFASGYYWSSSEYDANLAWGHEFYGWYSLSKANTYYVRPVRAF
jgi:hypothetical protein